MYIPATELPRFQDAPAALTPTMPGAVGSPHYIGQASDADHKGHALFSFEEANFFAAKDASPLSVLESASELASMSNLSQSGDEYGGTAIAISQSKSGTYYLAPISYGGFDDNGWEPFGIGRETTAQRAAKGNLKAIVGAHQWIDFGLLQQ